MIIGVPKETKQDEYRVGIIPVGVEELTKAGHQVLIEQGAGLGSGLEDEDFARHGAEIVARPEDVYGRAELVIKVKEPQRRELPLIRRGQVIFSYFHFAADRTLTEDVLRTGCVAVAFETIYDRHGLLPLLTPMSEVAGKMSLQEGAKYLERPMQGRGILLGGVPGVQPAVVVILGGGVVGTNAAKVAAGLGARVILMDIDINRLRYLADVMPANVSTIFSDAHMIRHYLKQADLVVGAVLRPGAKAPTLVRREDLATMKRGAVVVDVCVDQGGCFETTRPTTHSEPTYVVDGVVHYAVANIPGAVGRTSTYALANATLRYLLRLASLGYKRAAAQDPGVAAGINLQEGRVTNKAVAETFGLEHVSARLE